MTSLLRISKSSANIVNVNYQKIYHLFCMTVRDRDSINCSGENIKMGELVSSRFACVGRMSN